MLKQYTILLLFCLCAAHSAATSLSLRDCMEYAIAHSAKMEIQRANNDDARINLKITKTAIKMGITEEQQLRDQICLAVMEAYCNVLYFTQMTEALQFQVATANSNLQVTQRQEQLGQKSHADVIQLEADLAEREYQYITMTNQLNDARMTLQYEGILSTRQEPVMNP